MNTISVIRLDSPNPIINNDIINKKFFIVAITGTAKSALIDSLIKTSMMSVIFDYMMIVSPIEACNSYYKDKYNHADIQNQLENVLVDKLISICNNKKHILVILDNCITDNSIIEQLLNIKNLTLFMIYNNPMYSNKLIPKCDFLLLSTAITSSSAEILFDYVRSTSTIYDLNEFNNLLQNMPKYSFLSIENTNKITEDNVTDLLNVHCNELTNTTENDTVSINYYSNKIAIKYFELEIFREYTYPAISIIGNGNARHTTAKLARNIICNMNQHNLTKIDQVVVITKYNKDLYSDISECIHSTPDILKKILSLQKIKKRHYMIIFDLSFESEFLLMKEKEAPIFQDLLYNRHYGISYIAIFQYPVDQLSSFITQSDVMFVNCGYERLTEKFYQQYFSFIPSFNKFKSIYEHVCNDPKSYLIKHNGRYFTNDEDILMWTHVTDYTKIKCTTLPIELSDDNDIDFSQVSGYHRETMIDSSDNSDDESSNDNNIDYSFVKNTPVNDNNEYTVSDNMTKWYKECTNYTDKQLNDTTFDNKQKIITELKNKYDQQQSLIYSIKVILEKIESESNEIKNLFEKLN